jgi:hypothetical protein
MSGYLSRTEKAPADDILGRHQDGRPGIMKITILLLMLKAIHTVNEGGFGLSGEF